jgi:ADP-ribose pyrophosphatase
MDSSNPKLIYKARSFKLVEEAIRFPSGEHKLKAVIRHPGAVVLIPQLADGKLVMISQYRHPLDKFILEFPAGTLEKTELPLDCAKREIIEETGFRAESWIELGIQYPLPGICDELQHCYLARGLTPDSAEKDDDEFITTVTLDVGEIELAIRDGRLVDSKSIAILFRAKLAGLF